MDQLLTKQEINWQAVDGFLDSLVRIESPSEFCKTVVHSSFSDGLIHGCHLFSLDAKSNLALVSGYGITFDHLPSVFSTWDENPIATAVRTKNFQFAPGNEEHRPILVIPAISDQFPIGALALVMHPDCFEMPLQESLVPVIGKLAIWWLRHLHAGNSSFPIGSTGNGDNLTQRQLQILDRMAQGLINSEIAQELLVSESTVRQETVKIYRELGVPNRFEASKKARALGLVKRPAANNLPTQTEDTSQG